MFLAPIPGILFKLCLIDRYQQLDVIGHEKLVLFRGSKIKIVPSGVVRGTKLSQR